MTNGNGNATPRLVSLTINIRVPAVSQDQARIIEDTIRDAADDFVGVEINATTGDPRPTGRP